MPGFPNRESIELRLKAELDEAERQLQEAAPQELVEARRRYRHAIRRFSRFVVDDILQED